MRFASLGSGSKGNCTVVAVGSTVLLVDCGFSKTETTRRLARLGLAPDDVTAVVVTHEHSDHIGGVAVVARGYSIPVYLTAGTYRASNLSTKGKGIEFRWVCPHTSFRVGDIEVQPVPVPHDAREPAQYVFSASEKRLGLLTDLGSITPHVEEHYGGCDALMLECNHDPKMLSQGPYPHSLKLRVGGNYGHLSNGQAGELLRRLDTSSLQHLAVAHVSEKNNQTTLARDALVAAINCDPDWINFADQQAGLDWIDIK